MLTDPKEIGRRLKHCRIKLGLSHKKKRDGGMPLGVDQSEVVRWECGNNIPGLSKQHFAAWCCAVGMSFEDELTDVEKLIPAQLDPGQAEQMGTLIASLMSVEQEFPGFISHILQHVRFVLHFMAGPEREARKRAATGRTDH